MIDVLLWIVLPAVLIPLVIASIIAEFKKDPHYMARLQDWPRRKPDLPRDSHAQARQDGDFVDGIITGAILDDLDDMFH